MVRNRYTPVPVVTLIGAIVLAYVVNSSIPGVHLFAAPYNSLGWTVIGLGFLLAAWGIITLRSRNTTILPGQLPSALVTTGPFVVSRNPIYLGDLLIATGAAMVLSSLSAFIAPVLFFMVVNTVVITFEEQNLQAAFGDSYEEYRNLVRRWL